MNKKILISLSMIAAVAAIAVGGTIAYFSDTETSSGNTFTAGSIDLKVDNTCYFNKVADGSPNCPWTTYSSWAESDLVAGIHKFFYFTDLKPGDFGEDTISLHVYNNDAWGKLVIGNLVDNEGSPKCTEPELAVDSTCASDTTGDLRQNLSFWVWLDQGTMPGFQGKSDPGEGDNVYNYNDLKLITPGPINTGGETWNLYDGIKLAYLKHACTGLVCPGLTADGHMVGSITYYFGVGWNLPTTVGNEAQSDVFGGDMTLQVVQYRNNGEGVGPINW